MATEGRVRLARSEDRDQLLDLWATLFDEADGPETDWREHARAWFAGVVGDAETVRPPVAEVDGRIVATAIGTLELGVPNPYCLHGRTVRLANVVTVAEHRGHGHGTRLVQDVIGWARSIDADRVDLSSTPEGRHLYDRAGFVPTSAPRMKLVL